MRKINSRIIAFAAVIMLLAAVLAGCSSQDEIKLDPNNPITIVIWHYYNGAQKSALDNAVKEFNETLGFEEGIIVEAVSYGGVDELAENVMAAANGELDAGKMPDVFGSYGDTALEILNMDLAAEIDSYLTAEEIAEYEESFIHEGRIGTEKLYVFPIAKSTESLMLNKTDFDAFVEGLAASDFDGSVSYEDLATWEGILNVAEIYYQYTQASSPENQGKAFLGIDSLANYIIVSSKQLGKELATVQDSVAAIEPDREALSKIWDTYYNAMITGRFTKFGRFCSDDIKTGDSLGYIGSTASSSYFPTELQMSEDQSRPIEMIALPMPVFESGDKVAISQGAGMVIVKSEKEREYASAIFLKWFTDAERNVSFALNSSYLPVKYDALDEQILNSVFESINAEDVGMQNSIKALKVGIEQLRGYTLYSSPVFEGSVEFRDNLPVALNNAVAEDRAAYLELLESGVTPEDAFAQLTEQSRIKFDAWLESLKN